MKIAISANGKELSAELDQRFGRCAFFAIYDDEENKWSFVPNPGALEGSGAGIRAAQFLAEQKVDVLLTGHLGPKASQVLNSMEIGTYSLAEAPLEEVLKQYKQGKGRLIREATDEAHSGMSVATGMEENKQSETGVQVSGNKNRVAIATDGSMVAQHFGRCPAYTIFEIDNGTTINKTVVPNPGHEPGFLPRFLGEKGISCIIAGGMGPRAQSLFEEQGIRTVIGVTGPIEEVIESYLDGNLTGGESLCEQGQHGHGHDCEGH